MSGLHLQVKYSAPPACLLPTRRLFGCLLQVFALMLGRNRLTGPAFPPAWLDGPTMLPHLELFFLSENTALTGTLPAHLPWPRLYSL